MRTNGKVRKLTALFSSLLMLLTLLTPFSALAAENADGYEEVMRFSAFEKTVQSGVIGDSIYVDWTKADQNPVDLTDGHELKNLRLQLKFELTGPEGQVEMSSTWNKNGWLKLRSVDDNGENNYGWMLSSKSTSPLSLHSGENELLIPLVNTEGDGYDVTTTGAMDWTRVDRILLAIYGKDMKSGVSDHSIKITYAAVVDIGEQPDPVPTIEMPTIFGNNMMFQQNKPMKVWGTVEAGETVEVAFSKEGDTTALQTKTATADADGAWSVELDAMTASYQAYEMTITAKKDGAVTKSKTISDILIGEVWVAAGQSNMQMPVGNDLYGEEYAAAAVKSANGDHIRMYIEPGYPYGEKTEQPYEPEDDVPGAYWGKGSHDGDVLSVSGVGYQFALQMQAELNIPFGILYTPVGGSVIEAWIPKDAIDADAEYKEFLISRNKYCDESNWPAQGNRMSTLYNQKISALKGYNVAGTIWYQGESNIQEAAMYGHALTLMRDSWNEVFGYTTGTDVMPFIFTMVQPWITNLDDPQYLAKFAEGMYDGWKANEDRNMAMISIYDLPLYFLDRNGNSSDPIHPREKLPVGQRFATAAYNMVYADADLEYTAPVYLSHTPVDTDGDGINDAIDVTFDHVGDGLDIIDVVYDGDEFGVNNSDGLGVVSETDNIHGFAIAGTGGVYVDAKAVITGKDTVRVWSEGLKNPVNVTYNFVTYYTGGNLKNSVGIPVIPFRSDRSDTAAYFNMQDWKYADANVWTCFPKEVNGSTLNWADFLDAWVSGTISGAKADWSYDKDVKFEGRASLKVTYTPDATGKVGIGPVLGRLNMPSQFENFDTIAVSVKNGDARAKEIALLIKSNGKVYTAAVASGYEATTDLAAPMEASGDFTTYKFSLRNLTDESGKALTDVSAVLQNVEELQFTFTDNEAGTVYVDDVQFGFLYDENVDKTALNRELYWPIDEALYTAESLTAYNTAKESAKAVSDDPVATQSQVDRMAQTLKAARLSLTENNVIATFPNAIKTVTSGAVGNSLYLDWNFADVAPVDLTQYGDMSQLRLQIKFTLEKPEDIEETVALFNNYGFIKLRSVDTPAENNYGWLFSTSDSNAIRLHTGENELSIPLTNTDGDGYTILRTGTMDWSKVNRMMMMISSNTMQGRDGEFKLTVTEAKIVDLSVNATEKAELKAVIDQTVDTTGDADKVAAYERAKATAQAVYADEMSSLTAIADAQHTLELAIAVLNGASFTPADKTALKALTEETLDAAKYTPDSWSAYQKALDAANTVLANDYASQAVVDDAVDTLSKARAALLEAQPVDITELETLTGETLDLTKYTDASVKTYQDAMAAGEAILNSDSYSQSQVDNAVKAIKAAKEALKEKKTEDDASIVVNFSQNNGTFTNLLYGWQFYTNWKTGDGLPADTAADASGANLSGTADNGANNALALQATVTLTALKDGVDLTTCWKQMGFRLRSARVNGAEKAAQFYTIKPEDVTMENGTIKVVIPLSTMVTENIDWADVRELNVYCELNDPYRLSAQGDSDAISFTLADVKIAAMGDVPTPTPADKTALNNAIADAEAKLTDGKTYTADTLAALNTALTEAKALADDADQTAVDNATAKLNTAIAGLQEEPVVTVTPGDVNGDGSVTAEDALLALQAATKKITLDETQTKAADVDDTVGVSANDALMILQAATKKIALS